MAALIIYLSVVVHVVVFYLCYKEARFQRHMKKIKQINTSARRTLHTRKK